MTLQFKPFSGRAASAFSPRRQLLSAPSHWRVPGTVSPIPPTFGIPAGSVQGELLECAQLLMSPETPGNAPASQGAGLLQEGCLQAQVPPQEIPLQRPKGSSRTRRSGDVSWLSLQASRALCWQPRAHGMAGHHSGHRKGLPASDTHGTVPCTQAGEN